MIIKIDIDDNINDKQVAEQLAISAWREGGNLIRSYGVINKQKIEAKITHISKAGNIFIHVSKIKE